MVSCLSTHSSFNEFFVQHSFNRYLLRHWIQKPIKRSKGDPVTSNGKGDGVKEIVENEDTAKEQVQVSHKKELNSPTAKS